MVNQRAPEVHLLPSTGVTEAYGVHGTPLRLEGWGGLWREREATGKREGSERLGLVFF